MFFGIGLHVLVAIFFAVHAIKNGRQLFWLLILFSFPFLGSVVYFFAEFLPSSGLQHGMRRAGSTALRSMDPGRELREARQAFDLTPTAQNQMRLAEALLAAGNTSEAVNHFDQCLNGPFAKDAHIRLAAAQAKLQNSEPDKALELLLAVRRDDLQFQKEEVALTLAKTYGALDRQSEAKSEFENAVAQHGSVEARVEYGIWAASNGDLSTAENLQAELQKDWSHWPKHARQFNKALLQQLDGAIAKAR